MGAPYELTTGIQTVTTTGAVTPTAGLDISAIGATADPTICVEIFDLTAAKSATIQIEDSVNAFTASVPHITLEVSGKVDRTGGATKKFIFNKRDYPRIRWGTTSAVLRCNVVDLDGSATLKFHAWVDNG